MSISFELRHDVDNDGDTEALYLEVKSDALVVARVDITEWRDREDLSRDLWKIQSEVSDWGVEQDD